MKTKSLVYKKVLPLCVAIVFLLAFAAPIAAGQEPKEPAPATKEVKNKPAEEQKNGKKTDKENQKGQAEKVSPEPKTTTTSRNPATSPANNRNAPPPFTPQTGNTDLSNQGIADLKQEIAKIQESYVSNESFGLLAWFTAPVIGLIALLLIIALMLHLVHFFRLSSLNNFVARLAKSHAALGQATKGERSPVNNIAVEKLVAELDRQNQLLNQFSSRLSQVDGRLTVNDNQFEDAAHAITLAANWIGESQLKTASAAGGGNISDSERASTIAMLERYREPLRQNASRVEAVSQAFGELVRAIGGRAYVSVDLSNRVQTLFQGIHRFERWHAEVAEELDSLQLGSVGQRSYLFQLGQDRLKEQVNQGSLSVAQMVQKSRELMENYFPARAHQPVKATPAPADREANLRKIVDGACDYLMDWYNSLFQFQHQLEQGQRSAAEAELAAELSRVQLLAREALNKFDVQPEAIQIGQTQYDRRLHEAILVRQSQFPLNTVIEIHECGFRKMSTGEALRRPQVIVAGAGAN